MEIKEIIKLAASNYHCLKNQENWEGFAQLHELPSYEGIKKLFNYEWKTFKQSVFLYIAKTHIDHFYTPKYWDNHARNYDLPKSKNYRALFGDWKKTITLVHHGLTAEEIKRAFLLLIANDNKEYFEHPKVWDEFAIKHDLPVSATYNNHFNSWNEVVERVTGKKLAMKRYNKETLIKVMQEHKEHLITQETWKAYATEHQLPSVNTLAKHFGSFNAAKQVVSAKKIQKRVFSKEELIEVAQKHRDVFHTTHWNFYASTHQLPTETAYNNHFGHFKNLQKELGIVDGDFNKQTYKLINETIKKKQNLLLSMIQQNEILVEQLALKWRFLDSKKTWEDFANENKYPSYVELLAIFSTKSQLKQTLFLYIALKHKDYFNNKEWNHHSSLNNLPNKMNYYNLFSSWEWVQKMVWGDSQEAKKSYLLRIAHQHLEQFTTYNNWKEYASEHHLPSANQFENAFGGWNETKKILGLKQNR